MKITIAGSFTVNTVEDGEQGSPVPQYHEQSFGWSAMATTGSISVAPSDVTWTTYVPTQPSSKIYLWLRDRTMTWDSTNSVYVAGTYSFIRISGENGTGIRIKGSFTQSDISGYSSIEAYLSATYTNPEVGDGYMYEEDGHLWLWNGTAWQDVGQIKGDSGLSSYVHIAWAHAVGANGYPEDGMGFSTTKNPQDSYEYIGVYADNEQNDSLTPSDYEWSEIKGDGNVKLDLDNENDTMLYDGEGNLVSGNVTSNATLYIGGDAVTSGVTFSRYSYSGMENAQVTVSSAGLVTVTGMTSTSGYVMVQASYDGGFYYAKLTLKKLVNADKYDIIVNPSAISYNTDDLTPSSTSVTINIIRTKVTGTREAVSALLSGQTLKAYGILNNATEVSLSHTTGSTSWTLTTANASYTAYRIELKEGDNFLDSETIPINRVANGEQGIAGKNAVILDLNNENDSMQYADSDKITARVSTTATLWDGGVDKTSDVTNWAISASGCTASNSSNVITVTALSANYGTVTISATYNGAVYTAVFTVQKIINSPKYELCLSPNGLTYNTTTRTLSSASFKAMVFKTSNGSRSLVTSYENIFKLYLIRIASNGEEGIAQDVTSSYQTSGYVYNAIDVTCNGYRLYITDVRGTVLDSETIPLSKVTNGASGVSAFSGDLSNEMDSVGMSNIGQTLTANTLATKVTLYKGTTVQTITNLTVNDDNFPSGVTATATASTGVVNVSIPADTSLTNDRLEVPITAVCSAGTANLVFVILGVRAGNEGDSPIIYQLDPSATEIKVDKNGTRTPTSVSCRQKKIVGDTTTYVTEKTMTVSVDGGEASSYTSGSNVSTTSATESITFRIMDGTTVLDIETIPVVIDGTDGAGGENSIRLDIDNEMDSIIYDDLGNKKSSNPVTRARLYSGATPINATQVTWGHLASGITIEEDDANTQFKGYAITGFTSGSTEGTLTIKATYNRVEYTAVMSVKKLVNVDKYELVANPSAITYNSTTGAKSASSISVNVYKTSATTGERGLVTTLPSGMYLYQVPITNASGGGTASSVTYNSGYTLRTIDVTKYGYRYYIQHSDTILDSETIPISKVVNGEDGVDADSNYVAVLTNEMDGCPLDNSGSILNDTYLETQMMVYYGTEAQYITVTGTSSDEADAGVSSITYNAAHTVATISAYCAGGGNLLDNETLPITLTATLNNGRQISKVFSIVGIRAGADGQATIFQLVPSVTTIKKDANGNNTPSAVTCTIAKRVGNATPTSPSTSDNCTITYSRDGGTEQTYSSGVTTTSLTQGITFRLYQGTGASRKAVDTQSITVLKDGDNGTNAIRIDLSNQADLISCDQDGNVLYARTIFTEARIYDGDTIVPYSDFTVVSTASSLAIGGVTPTFQDIQQQDNEGVIISWSFTTSNVISSNATKDIILQYNGVTYTASFTLGITHETTIYQLACVPNALTFRRGADGTTLTPSTQTLETNVIKTDATGSEEIESPISKLGVYIYVDGTLAITQEVGEGHNIASSASDVVVELCEVTRDSDDNITAKGDVLDRQNIPIVKDGAKGASGENAVRIDITNEADVVSCDASGKVMFARSIVTEVKIYDGANVASSGVTRVTSLSNLAIGGVTPTQTSVTGGFRFTWNFTTSNTIPENVSKTIALRYNSVQYSAVFTLAVTNSPTIYQLSPNPPSLSFARNADDTFSPTDITLTTNIVKITSNGVSGLSGTENLLIYYAFDNDDTATHSQYDGDELTVLPTYSKVKLELWQMDSNGTTRVSLLDKETIPIVKDGAKGATGASGTNGTNGTDAVIYSIVVNNSNVHIDARGNISGEAQWTVYRTRGTTRATYSGGVSQAKFNNSSTWEVADGANPYQTNQSILSTDNTESVSAIDVRLISGTTVLATAQIPVTKEGKMGRNFYYAGEYSATATYTLTDFEAPFVSVTDGNTTTYWGRVGDNGSITGQAPSNTSTYWEQMSSQFKYLITEAVFTQFAKLGSAIFNGDYMYSQYGYMRGYGGTEQEIQDNTAYQHIDPTDIEGKNMDTETDLILYSSTPIEVDTDEAIRISDFAHLTAGTYYTLEITGNADADGEELDYWIRTAYNTRLISSYILFDMDDTTHYHLVRCVTTGDYALYAFSSSGGGMAVPSQVTSFYFREAKFAPALYMNMLNGEMVANKLTARGTLYASSFRYDIEGATASSGLSNYVPVGDNPLVCLYTLSTDTSNPTKVILPDPTPDPTTGISPEEGRRVELYAYKRGSFYVTWYSGTTPVSSSSYSILLPNGNTGYRVDVAWTNVCHAVFYCVNGAWRVMQRDITYLSSGRYYVLNSLVE